MYPLWLWARRSTAPAVFPIILAAALVLLFSRRGWDYEWGWAASQAASATILICPVVAGLVANEMARQFNPTIELVSRTVVRPARWSPALALCLPALGALAIAAVVAAVMSWRHRPGPPTELWVLLQAPAAVLGAAGFGLSVARLLPSKAAGPVAAVACYALGLVALAFGFPGLFSAGGATGSLIGAAAIPLFAIAPIVANLGILGAALLRDRFEPRGSQHHWWAWPRLVFAALVAAIFLFGTTFGGGDTYRTAQEAQICVGSKPVVCGPASGTAVLVIAQRSLARGMTRLSTTGLPLRQKYVMASGQQLLEIPEDSGLLRIGPDGIDGGAAGRDDVVATLAAPRLCQSQFEATPDEVVEDQRRLASWLSTALEADPAGRAPPEIAATYQRLANCQPARTSPS